MAADGSGGGYCLVCKKSFKSLMYTRKHLEIMHAEADPIECAVCSKVLSNPYSFRTHMNLKHGCKGVKNVLEVYGRRVNEDSAAAGPTVDCDVSVGADEDGAPPTYILE